MIGWSAGLRANQHAVQGDSDPTRDIVLQGEHIADVAVESVGPQMCVGLGIR
jgi:hypothetical protein